MSNVVDMFSWRLARASAEVERIQQDRDATREDADAALAEHAAAAWRRNEAQRRARERAAQALADARKQGVDGQVRG